MLNIIVLEVVTKYEIIHSKFKLEFTGDEELI